jgi:ABC-type glycerol-3-phosphate transport system permease component
LGIGPNPQSPIPNPQSPIPIWSLNDILNYIILFFFPFILILKYNKYKIMESKKDSESLANLKKEIMEFGFEEDKVDLALKMSNDKEEICNLIVRMMEEPEFLVQIKSNLETKEINSKNNDNKINNELINIFQNFSNQFQQYKMVIVVRKDLNMSVGKTSAQVAHAALGAYKLSLTKNNDKVVNWENFSGQAKIVLGVQNEKELFDIKDKADKNGLIYMFNYKFI